MAKMVKRLLKIKVSPEIGIVSAQYIMPSEAKCILILAHGAGAGMHHPFMESLADALAERDIATLRFNFPFTEQNKKRPDNPKVAQETIEAAIKKASDFSATLPVFIAGKSFGGRMSSQFLAAHRVSNVRGIVFYGFPLHAAGKPSVDRADHLKVVKVPMLFLQGTRDALARIDLIESVCANLKKAKLVKIEGADHSFKAGKTNMIEILAEESNKWIVKIL